jgi:hypothetical protein
VKYSSFLGPYIAALHDEAGLYVYADFSVDILLDTSRRYADFSVDILLHTSLRFIIVMTSY